MIGLHGGGCKVPNDVLNKLLEELGGTNIIQDEQFFTGMILPRLGKIEQSRRMDGFVYYFVNPKYLCL